MHFKTLLLSLPLTAALPAASILETRSGGSCSSTDFEPVQYLGGSTQPLCESNFGTSFSPIVSLTVWGGSQFVTAIQATYADNTQSPVYGATSGKSASTIDFNYSQNNTVTSLTLYGNANGGYVRHIRIENKAGTVLNVGYPNPVQAGYSAFGQNVGTGILFGFSGSTDGTSLNGVGFDFLASPLASIAVTNFNFTNPPQGDTDISPTDIDQYHAYNGQTSGVYNWAYNNQKTRTVTHAFQQTTTDTFAAMVSASISFGGGILIPGLMIGGGTSFTWTTANAYQTTATVAEAKQVQYNSGGALNPGKGVDAIFVAGLGTGNFAYISTVTITLKNGHQYSFQEAGSYFVDDVSDVIVDLYEDDKP